MASPELAEASKKGSVRGLCQEPSSLEQHSIVHLDKRCSRDLIDVRELVRGNLSAFTNFISSFSLTGLTPPLSPIEVRLAYSETVLGPACPSSLSTKNSGMNAFDVTSRRVEWKSSEE
ncbi:UNVERIFIED_CONTAM: hypothetical protein Sradi_7235200 [Sesamum radiatum]|uniref:Uncharacterized protein n=1 Tax=Sesamum radiatum TaxID=300843 RepID=A0AAW2INW4_SESRA